MSDLITAKHDVHFVFSDFQSETAKYYKLFTLTDSKFYTQVDWLELERNQGRPITCADDAP